MGDRRLRIPVGHFTPQLKASQLMVWPAIYGRVLGKWHFQTALTSANPNAKGGRLLHPTV